MDEIMDTRFGKMETALNTLIGSMATFNPSISALDALMEADDDLSRDIQQLAEHQANYERILTLRAMADTLDSQIKSTVQLIANTRTEILSLPWTAAGAPLKSVPVNDVLAFSKSISKFTLPPSGPERAIELDSTTPANDNDTTALATNPLTTTQGGTGQGDTLTTSIIPEDQRLWLDEEARRPWVPWPTEDVIRQGALADLTRRAAEGQAIPSTLEINTKLEAKNVAEEDEVPYSAMDLTSAIPRDDMPSAGPARSGERPKQAAFHGFGLYNPDADDT